MFNRHFVAIVLVPTLFSFTSAMAGAERICLPIGHPSLRTFPLSTQVVLKKKFAIAGVIIPVGCTIEIAYGPETTTEDSEEQCFKKRIIRLVKCENGLRLGNYLLRDALFDGDFCLEGHSTIAKAAKACGVPFEVGEGIPFVGGRPDCGEIIPGSTPTPSKRLGFE